MSWLYEIPWWVPAGVGLLGIVLFWTAHNGADRRLRFAGLAVMAIAVALGILSYFLLSDADKAIRCTRQLVRAVENRDRETMRRLLHHDIVVVGMYTGRDDVIDKGLAAVDYANIRSISITELRAKKDPEDPIVSVDMRVRVLGSDIDWQLIWLRTDNAWVLKRAEVLSEHRSGLKLPALPNLPKWLTNRR
jgi:hypothetical protein